MTGQIGMFHILLWDRRHTSIPQTGAAISVQNHGGEDRFLSRISLLLRQNIMCHFHRKWTGHLTTYVTSDPSRVTANHTEHVYMLFELPYVLNSPLTLKSVFRKLSMLRSLTGKRLKVAELSSRVDTAQLKLTWASHIFFATSKVNWWQHGNYWEAKCILGGKSGVYVTSQSLFVAKMKKEVKKMFACFERACSCDKTVVTAGRWQACSSFLVKPSSIDQFFLAAYLSHHILKGKKNKVKTNQKQIDDCGIQAEPKQTHSIFAFSAIQTVDFARHILPPSSKLLRCRCSAVKVPCTLAQLKSSWLKQQHRRVSDMKVTEFPWTVGRVVLLSPALSFERSGRRGAERTAARENSDRSRRGQSRHTLDGWTLSVYFCAAQVPFCSRSEFKVSLLLWWLVPNFCFVKRKKNKTM